MGTRSTIRFIEKYENRETQLVNIYQQFDGYIEGVGYELAKWLINKTIVNGFVGNDEKNNANGIGCLAAQFIKDFKKHIGGLYIVGSTNAQEYNYDVIIDARQIGRVNDIALIRISKYDDKAPVFIGRPSELLTFKEPEDDDAA